MHTNITALLMARRIELINELVEIEHLLTADQQVVAAPNDASGFQVSNAVAPTEAEVQDNRVQVAAEEVPAIPDDDEPVWLSGHGKVTYQEARKIANENGFTVVVSTGKGGPSIEEQHRIATLQPTMDATNLPPDLQ